MEIQGASSNFLLKNVGLHTGQRILVEVLKRELDGKAQIRLAGQEIAALLDIPAEAGETFWAVVQKVDENGILLVREKGAVAEEAMPPALQNALERLKLGNRDSLSQLLNQALERLFDSDPTSPSSKLQKDLMQRIARAVPEWSQIVGEAGEQAVARLIQYLGLDYERRIRRILKLPGDLQGKERTELTQTLKGILLSFLTSQGLGKKDQERLGSFLERLTEQQLLLQGLSSESPFYLLELPLQQEGRIYNQRLAIKGPRKGNKIDWNHCRIALQAQTPILGELAIDGWLYAGQLSLKVFCHDPKEIAPLVDENLALIREQFYRLGITLHSIGVAPIIEAEEFHRFMRGEHREGVDIRA